MLNQNQSAATGHDKRAIEAILGALGEEVDKARAVANRLNDILKRVRGLQPEDGSTTPCAPSPNHHLGILNELRGDLSEAHKSAHAFLTELEQLL